MSLNRHTMLILMLAGSVGLPYLSSTELGQKASRAMEDTEQPRGGVRSSDASTSSPSHAPTPAAPSAADSSSYASSPTYSGYSATDPANAYSAQSTASAPTPARAVSVSPSAVATGSAAGGDKSFASADQNNRAASSPSAAGGPANGSAEPAKRTDGPPHTLAEVLRFDITVPWIIASWPRVSAGLSELDLHGYRVPLVTGTGESDLAGSLTYYFNKKQQLDRIIFHGTGGDPRPLITLVTNDFELKRVIVSDPGLAFYQKTSWGRSHSELLIRPARVLRADNPNKRYEIEMAIKRP